jgi:hypothetical protein
MVELSYGFMGKDWDKTLPPKEIFEESLRVLKPGGFAFVMSAPRSDVQYRMVQMLEEVGFQIGFTPIYWTYATGFPKAMNIGKAVDKRLGKERDVTGKGKAGAGMNKKKGFGVNTTQGGEPTTEWDETDTPASDEAKKLDGSYAGYQPKPAVEVVIVAMKPLDQKGYLDQALDNQKGVTWLDDCRIPFAGMNDTEQYESDRKGFTERSSVKEGSVYADEYGGIYNYGFKKPVSKDLEQYNKDNVGSQKNFDTDAEGLSRGNQPVRKTKSDYDKYVEKQESFKGAKTIGKVNEGGNTFLGGDMKQLDPSETYQKKTTKRKPREEDTVFKTSGFKSENDTNAEASPLGRFAANLLISDNVLDTGKKTKSSGGRSYQNTNDMYSGGWAHDDEGTNENPGKGDVGDFSRYYSLDEWWKSRLAKLPEEVQRTFPFLIVPKASKSEKQSGVENNIHPTVKPLKLMSYLITLGSRKGDVVLDPFMGSGTTPMACVTLSRNYIGIEREAEYFKIAQARVNKLENPIKQWEQWI